MNFGEKLARLRRDRRWTQKDLADEVGLSLRTITNYETGGRYPKRREIYKRLADCLEVDVDYLVKDNDEDLQPEAIKEEMDKGMLDAQRIIAEVRGMFSGGALAEEDKDEMMRAIQDAYWIAKEHRLAEDKYFSRRKD